MKDWRITFVFFIIVASAFAIAGRLFYVQIHQGGYYGALARGQNTVYVARDPVRGDIFFQDNFNKESNLYLAATNKDWPLLYAVPSQITDAQFAAAKLAPILKKEATSAEAESDLAAALLVEVQDIYEKLKDLQDPYKPLARRLSEAQVEEIEALDIAGVYIQPERLRHYPAKNLAGTLLGFVGYRGADRVGQYGLEGFYDDTLRGVQEEARGPDLILSIDYNIQFMLEKKLAEAKEFLEAESATAIIIDPRTGELIALASTDSFDPNAYSKVENIDRFLNGAVQKIFEPGSIFKPFTMATALDMGLISPQTTYNDTGRVRIGTHTIKNSTGEKYGIQSMTNVLELSLNTGAVFIQELIGQDSFRDYMERFGFGARTGVDLQGEVSGDIQNILYTSRDINFATAAFGQGIAVTPLQLVAAFSAFANGGEILRPRVVREIVRANGTREVQVQEVLTNPISSKTAAQITSMLVSVVENGYGKKAAVVGYKVAGKTGTAQVPKKNGRGYEEDKTIHSFIGYAPAYDPRFLALIKVDDPQGINFSSDSVAPLFSEIAEYILNYYEIPPDS